MTNPGIVQVKSYDARDWELAAGAWAELARESPYASFFLSPEWTSAWLDVYGPTVRVEILVFRHEERAVGACLLVRTQRRRGPVPVRAVFLNTAGETDAGACVEFNNLLCLENWEDRVAEALVSYVDREPWDEVYLDGFSQGPPLDALRRHWSGATEERQVLKSYYVDLTRLRETGVSFESTLGPKDRARLRQNLRHYGDTAVTVPSSAAAAAGVFQELSELHKAAWRERRQAEVDDFSSPLFQKFHEKLMERAFDSGTIQLARVAAGEQLIGILYNFVYRSKVYFYQSGLAYNANRRVRPGFVSIGRTIQYCAGLDGLDEFHLMAGGDHYKAPLARDNVELEWTVFQKRNFKNWLIRLLRRAKSRVGARMRPNAPGATAETDATDS